MAGRLVRKYAVFEGIQVVTGLVSLNLTNLVEIVKLGVVVQKFGRTKNVFKVCVCICK